jgi:Gluconate 2-dehydrogenase subunit 3
MPGRSRTRLPQQRRGTTPQLVGRYPDFDVLELAQHWDEATRRIVLARVRELPAPRFFDEAERATLNPLCDRLTGQGREPRIPVLHHVDEKLASGVFDGYRYADLPDDGETWRLTARALDAEARSRDGVAFGALGRERQRELCAGFARGELQGEHWEGRSVSRVFGVVIRYVCEAFYAHPWAWNEIGFPGPAYPRGFTRFGSPHLRDGETETWEATEAFERDPVTDGDREEQT